MLKREANTYESRFQLNELVSERHRIQDIALEIGLIYPQIYGPDYSDSYTNLYHQVIKLAKIINSVPENIDFVTNLSSHTPIFSQGDSPSPELYEYLHLDSQNFFSLATHWYSKKLTEMAKGFLKRKDDESRLRISFLKGYPEAPAELEIGNFSIKLKDIQQKIEASPQAVNFLLNDLEPLFQEAFVRAYEAAIPGQPLPPLPKMDAKVREELEALKKELEQKSAEPFAKPNIATQALKTAARASAGHILEEITTLTSAEHSPQDVTDTIEPLPASEPPLLLEAPNPIDPIIGDATAKVVLERSSDTSNHPFRI